MEVARLHFGGVERRFCRRLRKRKRACFVEHFHYLYILFCLSFRPEFGHFALNVGCKKCLCVYFLPSTNVFIPVSGVTSCLEGILCHLSVSDRLKQQSWGMENLLSEDILHSHHFGSNWFSLYKWSRRFTGCCHKVWRKRIRPRSDTLWYQW